jgi:Tol biopolymer transport system component
MSISRVDDRVLSILVLFVLLAACRIGGIPAETPAEPSISSNTLVPSSSPVQTPTEGSLPTVEKQPFITPPAIAEMPLYRLAFKMWGEQVNNHTYKEYVFTILSDGTGIEQLTSEYDFQVEPLWSPDGKYIAFITFDTNPPSLVLMHFDKKEVLREYINVDNYDWSEDEQTVVFSDFYPLSDYFPKMTDGYHSIFLSEIDIPDLHLIIELESNIGDIYWSPSGDEILLFIPTKDFGLYLLDFEGNLRTIGQSKIWCCAAWSPTGDRIAYSVSRDGLHSGISVINREDFSGTWLDLSGSDQYGPVWSPDGRKIAYESEAILGMPSVIYIKDLETEEDIQVSEHGQTSTSPSWSPNGHYLAFLTQTNSEWPGEYSLNVFSLEDGTLITLVKGGLAGSTPVWQPIDISSQR